MKPLSIKYGLGVPDHDTEGRVVTVEFDDFYLLTAYVPNSGDGLRRLVNHWYFPYSISHLRLKSEIHELFVQTYRVTEWDPSLGNYMKVCLFLF